MSATELVEKVCKAAHEAQYALAGASAERKNEMLRAVAKAIRQGEERLLEVNKEDVKEAKASGMSFAMVDRLTLTRERIALMAEGVEHLYNREYKRPVVSADQLMAAIDAYYEQYGAK